MKNVNAWICALLTTDHDSVSVIADKKRKSATIVIFSGPDVFFFELISPVTGFEFT